MQADKQTGFPPDSLQPSTIMETSGEVLDDALVDLIRDGSGQLKVSVWHGEEEDVGPSFRYGDTLFCPPSVNRSLLSALTLPGESLPYGSTPDLLSALCRVIGEFTDLPDKSLRLLGRFPLATWLVDAFRTAPGLVIDGPQAEQLLDILRPLCRHSLLLTAVTPARFCMLPSRMRFTLLISQSTISDSLWNLLDDASSRGRQILYNREVLDLYGAQVIHADAAVTGNRRARFLDVMTLPTEKELPALTADIQDQVASNFQPKLLAYRRANICKALTNRFDASKFVYPVRPLVQTLAAVTPDDADLQAELTDLLREHNDDFRSCRWIETNTVVLESIQVACHGGDGVVYVGQLAETAREILNRRGSDRQVDAGEIGRSLKALGFTTEPRDARGVRLRITPQICERARQLAGDLGLPFLDKDEPDATEHRQESKLSGEARAGADV